LAGAAFKDQGVLTALTPFIPVLVDGDTEKGVLNRFSVSGFPHIRFVTPDGKEHGEVGGFVPTEEFLKSVQAATQSIGPIRYSKPYIKLMKAKAKLTKALAKEKYKDALKAIADIEKVGHEGPDLSAALKEKAKIAEVAAARLEEAKALLESAPDQAKSLLGKLKTEFKGLPAAEQAAELSR